MAHLEVVIFFIQGECELMNKSMDLKYHVHEYQGNLKIKDLYCR